MKSASSEKEEGDHCYKSGRYSEAISHYTAALKIDYETGEDRTCSSIKPAVVHANRAMCYLRIQQYNQALMDCNSALGYDPHYRLLCFCFSCPIRCISLMCFHS